MINLNNPEFYVDEGNQLASIGKIKEAKVFYKKAIGLDKNFFPAYFNLAILLQKEKKYDEAILEYKKSLKINNNFFGIYTNLSNCYEDIGNNSLAIKILQYGYKQIPSNYEIIYSLSLIYNKIENINSAHRYCIEALQLEPNSKRALKLNGQILKKKNLINEALNNFYKSLSANNKKSNNFESLLLTDIAECYLLNGEIKKAILFLKKAIKIDPNNKDSYNFLGIAYKSLGNFDKAIKFFKFAFNNNSNNVYPLYNMLDILNEPIDAKHLPVLKNILQDNSKNFDTKVKAGLILSFVYEKKKDYKNSFNYLGEANKIKRNQINYSSEVDTNYADSIIKIFNKKNTKKNTKETCISHLPIFIIGMPRSGSTLIEQIISSHSKVLGLGEKSYFADSLNEMIAIKKYKKIYPDVVQCFSNRDFKIVGDLYEKKIKKNEKKYLKITDKNLLNFFYIGLIHLSLPNAKIIHCKRNQFDTCVSCFKKDFTGDYRFTYDLNELVNFYNLYEKLMKFWHKLFPNVILDVQYENIVNNFTVEVKKILNFCNLDWEENCKKFYNNKRVVLTTSDSQVRKPLHKNSIDSWKKYKEFLKPLQNIGK